MVLTKTVFEDRVESLKMLIEIIFVMMEMVMGVFCRIVELVVAISAVYNGNFRDESQSDDKKRQMSQNHVKIEVNIKVRAPLQILSSLR